MSTNQTYNGEIRIVIPNKYVACKPYKPNENKNSVFTAWELKNPLVELEVVFQDKEKEYIPGSFIYVRPFLEQPSWIKDSFTLNGQEIILIPKEQIVGYKYVEETPVQVPNWVDWTKWPNVYGPYGTGTSYTYTLTGTGTSSTSYLVGGLRDALLGAAAASMTTNSFVQQSIDKKDV